MSQSNKTLRGLTLHQPYASLIADGRKQYETRSWKTAYRGPLLIHAGKKHIHPNDLSTFGYDRSDLPLGAIVAVVRLSDCLLMDTALIDSLSDAEKQAGHWSPGRYAWALSEVRKLERPIPCRGFQQLWTPSEAVLGELGVEGAIADANG